MVRFSNGQALATTIGLVPNHSKTRPFKFWALLSRFQMVFDKMVAICLDFKWLGFWISDPIWNPDHLQPYLWMTIQNPDLSGFQISTVFILTRPKACRSLWLTIMRRYLCFSFARIRLVIVHQIFDLPRAEKGEKMKHLLHLRIGDANEKLKKGWPNKCHG